jgi:hypothetical protein
MDVLASNAPALLLFRLVGAFLAWLLVRATSWIAYSGSRKILFAAGIVAAFTSAYTAIFLALGIVLIKGLFWDRDPVLSAAAAFAISTVWLVAAFRFSARTSALVIAFLMALPGSTVWGAATQPN